MAAEKLTISWIRIYTEYDGKVLTDKKGRKYARIKAKFTEKGDQDYSAMSYREDDPMRAWRVGNVVEAELETNESNGKTYYNIATPKPPKDTELLEQRVNEAAKLMATFKKTIEALEARVKTLEGEVRRLKGEVESPETT